MKIEIYFILDIIMGILYHILYGNREMLQDGSIRCAQAGGPDQASYKPCLSSGMHCRASRVLEGGINMQDRSIGSTIRHSWRKCRHPLGSADN